MRSKGTWLLYPVLCLLLAFSVAVPAFADGPPPTPHSFYGTVTIAGLPAPAETTVVEAQGTGVLTGVAGNPITTTVEGLYGSSSPLGPWLVVQGYIDEGTPIEFYVNGARAECYDVEAEVSSDTYPFHSAAFTELNLTVGVAPQYDLTVASTAGGSVTTPGEGTFLDYDAGTVVDLLAVADTGYEFLNWTGNVGTVAAVDVADTTITMNGDYSITANFALIGVTYDLTVASTAGGSVTAPGEPGPFTYDAGTVVDLLAVADTGYEFVNWTGEVTTVAAVDVADTTITMNGDYSITANFALIGVTYDLTVASTAGGSVTTPGEGTFLGYDAGTVVDLLAVADTGYEFVDWTGEVTTVAAVDAADTTITMNGDYSITANFAESGVTYTLFVSSSDGGSVTVPGEGTFLGYDAGTVVDLLAVPDAGYELDRWFGDVADVNAPSTTITMNDDEVVHANFAESLGDLIDGTESGGTLDLPAGTYSGGTIDKPMTITGTTGTVIHGGITIGDLTGSDVTIENLTITDYTDFGIRIVKVGSADTFIIRNNTLQGVSGSVIGIKVDEVETGGSLTIECNGISGNETGIKLLAAVADGSIWFNDITDNTIYGLQQLAVGSNADASINWWGDISGPQHETMWDYTTNPGGTGDVVSDNIDYTPWLTRVSQTVLDDNIAYFGNALVWLDTGWNIISTPIALDPACDTWAEYVTLGDDLSIHPTSPAYAFDPTRTDDPWMPLTGDNADYRLEPCDAIYVRMAEPDIAAILYSPNVSVPSKQLYAGWNLVGLAWMRTSLEDPYGLTADEALVSVAEVTGGYTGYVQVVSPSVGYQYPWTYTGDPSQISTTPNWETWENLEGWMFPAEGYWVFMLNDGTLAGFAFTPVSLD